MQLRLILHGVVDSTSERAFAALLEGAGFRIDRVLPLGPVYSLMDCRPA